MNYNVFPSYKVSEQDFKRIIMGEINYIVTQSPQTYPINHGFIIQAFCKVCNKWRLLELPCQVLSYLDCGCPPSGNVHIFHVYFYPDSFEMSKFEIILGL